MTDAIVLFDSDCQFCEWLAAWGSKREPTLRFESWQHFAASAEGVNLVGTSMCEKPITELRVWTGRQMLEGQEAWQWLLSNYKDFKALNWIASRLGLVETVSTSLNRGGKFIRARCRKCAPYKVVRTISSQSHRAS